MDESATIKVSARPEREDFLGHPKGLSFLFATEMWERFSYYGMRALLVLYMTEHLLDPSRIGTVIGFGAFKSALEVLFGPLAGQPLASQIYGWYTGLVYLTPIFGGYLADRALGHRRTVILGALLMATGHFLMASDSLFLFALLALILGNGAFKPNISTQVGDLYAPGDPRRDRAYSVFYVGINLGAFLAPLVCGTLGEEVGWHYGFAAAGFGMLISLAIYLYGTRHLPKERAPQAREAKTNEPLERQDWQAIGAIILLCLFVTFFWATYEQQGNTINIWAADYTDRTIDLFGWRTEIPATWFQALNPFMIFAFTPFVVTLWARQAKHRREPSTVTKMALGCFGVALGNTIMIVAAIDAGSGKANWVWLVAYFAAVTLGELYLSPIGLSLISKTVPRSILSMMMGIWLATSFTGNFIAGWLGSFWSAMGKPQFFLMIAGVAATAGLAILLFSAPLKRRLNR